MIAKQTIKRYAGDRKIQTKWNKEKYQECIIRNVIKRTLDEGYNKTEYGTYLFDIYTDYTDELDSRRIKEILSANSPMDAFNEILFNGYEENESIIFNELIYKAKENISNRFTDIDDSLDIEEMVREYIEIEYPFDHFRSQKINVNLILDTGDGDYEYTCNNLIELLDDEEDNSEYIEASSLVWLAKQQGYSISDIKEAILNSNYQDSKFLASLDNEIYNATTRINSLTFLCDLTLGELLDYTDEKRDIKEIKIHPKTNCGLVDYWNGAGSLIELELEKDVVIPSKFIDSISIDGDRGCYSIKSIYGLFDSEWNGTVEFVK